MSKYKQLANELKQHVESEILDVLWGVPAIARFIKRTPRQTNYLIQKKIIPVTRHGHRTITASPAELRKLFAPQEAQENFSPEDQPTPKVEDSIERYRHGRASKQPVSDPDKKVPEVASLPNKSGRATDAGTQ